MDQNRWKFSEVVRLKNAVANYKLMHGDNFIVWNDVRVESGLTRFSALSVRQKYINISRGKNGNPTVSDPAVEHGILVNGIQSGVHGTKKGDQRTQGGHQGTQGGHQGTQGGLQGTQREVLRTQGGLQGTRGGIQGTQSRVRGTQSGVHGTQNGIQRTKSGDQGTQSGVNGTQNGVNGTQNGVYGTQREVQGTEIRIRQTDVQPNQCSSAEINRTAIAALKVGARTAAGVEFRNYVGFDGGPKQTPKLYMDRLKAALKDGTLDPNWLTDPAKETTAMNDWGRQERRDMAKLRNDEKVVVLEKVTTEDVSEQLHRQNPSISTQTNTKHYKALRKDLSEKYKWANDDGSRQRITVGLSKSLRIEPDVSIATENRRLPVDTSYEVQQPLPKKRNTDHSLFDDAIIGPYGVLLPTPTGFASNHVFRNFTDNEWRKIILEIKSSSFNILSDEYRWKKLANKAGITCSIGGLEIQLNFCKHAIPRLQELMACFVDVNAGLEQEITEPSRCTDIFIFHSLKKLQLDQVMLTVRTLSNLKCISVAKTSLSAWCACFVSNVLQKSEGHFKCREEDLQNLRGDVIKMTLQYCNNESNGK